VGAEDEEGQAGRVPSWRKAPIVSGRTVECLAAAEPGELSVSLDLGLTRDRVTVGRDAMLLPDGQRVAISDLRAESSAPEDCIEISGGTPRKVYIYDEARRKYYKLFQPSEDRAPTIVINGAAMHAIVRADPWTDAAAKVAALPRAEGACLDTCGGLGYSAQLLADAGFQTVTTCEEDPNVLSVAAVNPYSRGLFERAEVHLVGADVRRFVARCAAGRFRCVFHDPPTIFQAGDLYAEELYAGFARALGRGGVCYHYVGEPGKRSGRDHAHGVMRRMQASGFRGLRRVTGGVLGTVRG
jgi:hypothetical protein